jgi:hypothetical protein
MDLAEPIAILISGILSLSMINSFMGVAPGFQLAIHAVFIGKNECTGLNGLTNDGLNGLLLDIGEHLNDHFPAPLDHAQNRRLFFVECASPWTAFQPSAASRSPLLKHRFGMPFVSGDDLHFITFHCPTQLDWLFLTTIPSRSCVVMSCTTSLSRSSSAAICWLDKFKPMKYKHNTHTLSG